MRQYPMEAGSDDEDDGQKDDAADQLAIDKTRSKLQAQHAERYKGIQQLDRELRNQLLKKDIETLARQVDHVNSTGRQAYRDHVRNLVVQDFRNAELNKVTDILKEVEFAEPFQLHGMFDYRQKNALERLRTETEVLKEYRAGEYDKKPLPKPKKKKKALEQ